MSLKISSIPIGARGPGGNNQVKLRLAESKSSRSTTQVTDSQDANQNDKSIVSQEKLRYEVSALNRKSVELQETISERQTTVGSLEDLQQVLRKLEGNPDIETLKEAKQIVGRNPEIFKGQANRSDNDSVEPITVSRPPKVGSYSVEIMTGETRHPEAVSYTIKLVDEEGTQKTVTASLSPATGLIEGVQLYFETDADSIPATASLEIKDESTSKIEVPEFKRDLGRLESAVAEPELFSERLEQTTRKLESVTNAVKDDLGYETRKFLTLNNAQENLRASESDFLSVNSAFDALDNVKSDLKNFADADQLFTNQDPTQAKNLLE